MNTETNCVCCSKTLQEVLEREAAAKAQSDEAKKFEVWKNTIAPIEAAERVLEWKKCLFDVHPNGDALSSMDIPLHTALEELLNNWEPNKYDVNERHQYVKNERHAVARKCIGLAFNKLCLSSDDERTEKARLHVEAWGGGERNFTECGHTPAPGWSGKTFCYCLFPEGRNSDMLSQASHVVYKYNMGNVTIYKDSRCNAA